MPLYEFQCNDCAAVFEVLVISQKDKEAIHCKKCKGVNVKKILSPPALRTASSQPFGSSSPQGLGGCGSGGFS